jgi:hypothetical protein
VGLVEVDGKLIEIAPLLDMDLEADAGAIRAPRERLAAMTEVQPAWASRRRWPQSLGRALRVLSGEAAGSRRCCALVANAYSRLHPRLPPTIPDRLAWRPIAKRLRVNGGRLDMDRGRRVVGTGCSCCAKDRTGRETTEYTGCDLAIFSASAAGERGYRGTDHRDACQNE